MQVNAPESLLLQTITPMKHPSSHALALVLLASLGLLAGCGKPASSSAPAAAPAVAAPTQPAANPKLPELKIELTANDQMKFNLTLIEAQPGQKVTVKLKNVGTMPKMSMGHNFVLLARDVVPAEFVEASQTHMGNEFIAPELARKVLAHTKLLGPGESASVTFVAPRTPGDYTYICSFPGHFAIGMKGLLKVK